jgi:hypothetical protein
VPLSQPKKETTAPSTHLKPSNPSLWWWQRGQLDMSKEQAEAVLRRTRTDGDFLVRLSHDGQLFVLSRFYRNRVLHARVVATDAGFRFDGPRCTLFPTIEALIAHHQAAALDDGCVLLTKAP